MDSDKGFSGKEFLVVLVVAIALLWVLFPMSTVVTSEKGAVRDCFAIGWAEKSYAAQNGGNFADIETLIKSGLLNPRFREVKGYSYHLAEIRPDGFSFRLYPETNKGRYIWSVSGDSTKYTVKYEGLAEGWEESGDSKYNPGQMMELE